MIEAATEDPPALRVAFNGCPLCGSESRKLRTAICKPRGALPADITWMRCTSCGHIHTEHYFNADGCAEMFSKLTVDGVFGGNLDVQRWLWSQVIHRLLPHVQSRRYDPKEGRWIDVGIGNGGFLFTASEFGFDAVGIDLRPAAVDALKRLGYRAELADARTFDYAGAAVVVLADVLEHVPFPRELLQHVRRGLTGALFVSCPNVDSVSWRYMDAKDENMFWREQEHYHNFSRASLERLLVECGFKPVDYAISQRYQACMEVIAV